MSIDSMTEIQWIAIGSLVALLMLSWLFHRFIMGMIKKDSSADDKDDVSDG